MRKIKLSKYEQWIEDHIDEFVPVNKQLYKELAEALERKRKDTVLNIRVNSYDLKNIKQKARKMGVKYQTFISEFLHKLAQA